MAITSSCSECDDDKGSKGRKRPDRWPERAQLAITKTCAPKRELKESRADIDPSWREEFVLGNNKSLC